MSGHNRDPSGLPTPPSTASGSTRRSRRTEASSESESNIGTFDISNVDLRVVTPPRPLPLTSFAGSQECMGIKTEFGDEFQQQAIQFAMQCDIPAETLSVSITAREFRDDRWDSQPTVLIVVDEWTEASRQTWEQVVRRLKIYIDERVSSSFGARFIDISVEMIARDLLRLKYCAPLDTADPAYERIKSEWPKIKARIYDLLERYDSTRGRMTAIALFELGFNEYSRNPKTVYVSVDYTSRQKTWPIVLKQMQEEVDKFQLGLHVHLEHNLMGHYAFNLLPPNLSRQEIDERKKDYDYMLNTPYKTGVMLGDDISAGHYITRSDDGQRCNPMVGTLGCWLQVNVRGKGWVKMALTNYHVIRPCLDGYTLLSRQVELAPAPDIPEETTGKVAIRPVTSKPIPNSDLWNADRFGLSVDGLHRDTLRVEHPSRMKHNFTVNELKYEIANNERHNYPCDNVKVGLNDVLAFFDSGREYLGHVVSASGYLNRTDSNGRLDWALVQPISDDRIGGNKLPEKADWVSNGYNAQTWPSPHTFGAELKPQLRSIYLDLQPVDRVFKNGASTKATVGQWTDIKMDCIIEEEKYMGRNADNLKSTEFMFFRIHDDGLFANRGDSGSVVWGKDGHVLGLVFTGNTPQQVDGRPYALVTPIEDIFKSIIQQSGGEILEVRILGAEY
ncbi:hypothetical protein B0H67DRAFT_300502 [Lasiosphaeris hirsuta]|uniref:Uncharacterized protein n=1 Tax=Lasiosphaeris hirsuta TaxID=260670 RepID=A0AA40A9I6_9PEZI|nr:hypothetical protein B0H67DRAFT_300502 [Lasiosphaeris hirsuta]